MIDGFHAGHDRATHPFRCGGVCHDVPATRLRDLDNERHLRLRERWSRCTAGTPSIVGVDLDPIGAAPDLVAHDARQFFGATGFLGTLRDVHLGSKTARSVRSAHHDCTCCDDQAGSVDDALLHRAFQPDVRIGRAFGAKIAQGGETGAQRALEVDRGTRDAQAEWLLEHLIVPVRLVVRMQQHVRVQIDHAGHQRHTGQIDYRCISGRLDRRRWADGCDATVLHQHHNATHGCGSRTVEDARRSQEE